MQFAPLLSGTVLNDRHVPPLLQSEAQRLSKSSSFGINTDHLAGIHNFWHRSLSANGLSVLRRKLKVKHFLAATFCACLPVAGYVQSASAGDRNLFVGAIRGETQLGIAANSALLRASGHVGLFMTTLSLLHAIVPDPSDQEDWGGSVANGQAIVSAFAGNGPGIIDGNLDAQTTPMSRPPTITTRATMLGCNGYPRSTGRHRSFS